MLFKDQLNIFMKETGCNAKQISELSELSTATLSRYRNGERVPEASSNTLSAIAKALEQLSSITDSPLQHREILDAFLACSDIHISDNESFRNRLNSLIDTLDLSITDLCKSTGYETSAFFRIRRGTRNPSDPIRLGQDTASYITRECTDEARTEKLNALIDGYKDADMSQRFEYLFHWLMETEQKPVNDMESFLKKLDSFDLNDFIASIHYDEMKVPTAPFQLPSSRYYHGLQEMMKAEIDFLKATVLARSKQDVIMYSDVPMEEMSKDAEFPKKWMFGMAMMLKKGLHLNMIHNIDRPMHEMMLGLESWIPMYMTGQVSPYYLKDTQSQIFHHLIKVSGSAALNGEGVKNHHSDGRYYLTNNKEEVRYYRKNAEYLLEHAKPLMEIFRLENAEGFQKVLEESYNEAGKRRNILSAPSLFTIDHEYLKTLLDENNVDSTMKEQILTHHLALQKKMKHVLETDEIVEELPYISDAEFQSNPPSLCLSDLFPGTDIHYTKQQYQDHLAMCDAYARMHSGYHISLSRRAVFRNLQIFIITGKYVIVSKNNSPAIHFVIRHPRLCSVIENFIPPMVEE